MKIIETKAVVKPDGTVTVRVPPDVLPGEHQVVLVIEEKPTVTEARPPLRFSAYPVGPVSEDFTFRREDLYGDDGQ